MVAISRCVAYYTAELLSSETFLAHCRLYYVNRALVRPIQAMLSRVLREAHFVPMPVNRLPSRSPLQSLALIPHYLDSFRLHFRLSLVVSPLG